ncbi:hypothetical protein T439DRAFT_88922 [Meredithblackwellia eburnea MCA 4105]
MVNIGKDQAHEGYTQLTTKEDELPAPLKSGEECSLSVRRLTAALLGIFFLATLVMTVAFTSFGARSRSGTIASSSTPSHSQFFSTGCSDPYLEPGYLVRNLTSHEGNRWVPFNPSCTAPSLLSRVKNGDDLPWLHGRTVVLVGASVERRMLVYLCDYLGGDFQVITPSNPLHPPPPGNATKGWDYREPDPTIEKELLGARGSPSKCYIPSRDLLFVLAFHTGVDDSGFWSRMPLHWYLPFRAQERVTDILLPLLHNLNRPINLVPDLLTVSSYEWDAKLLFMRTRNNQLSSPADINEQYSVFPNIINNNQLSSRLAQLVRTVLEAFPSRTGGYPILWRIGHEIDAVRHYHLTGKLWTRVTEEVIRRPEFEGQIIETRIGVGLEGMKTESGWMNDAVHPSDLPFNYVWVNHLLFHLRRAVTGGDE